MIVFLTHSVRLRVPEKVVCLFLDGTAKLLGFPVCVFWNKNVQWTLVVLYGLLKV